MYKTTNMKKMLMLIVMLFWGCTLLAQPNKKIDSLKIELKKDPMNFYLNREIINYYINKSDIEIAKKEIDHAKILFKYNLDYANYFRINDVYLFLINGDVKNADKRLKFYEKSIKFENFPITKIHLNFFRGVIFQLNGNIEKAKNYFEVCFQTIKSYQLEKKYFLNIYNFYANTLVNIGKYQTALEVLFEILEVKEFKVRFPVYNSIGVCYYNLKQFKNAEKFYKLSVLHSDSKNLPQLSSNLALLLLELKKNKEADDLLISLDYKNFTSVDSSMVFSALAEIEKRKKNFSYSIKLYNTVIKIDSKDANKRNLLNDFLALGNLYKSINEFKLADKYFEKAYVLSDNFEDKNAEKGLLESMIELEFIKSNNDDGKIYFDKLLKISDTINSIAIQSNSNELNLKYETELKESKIKTQQLQIQKEKTNKYIAFGGIGLLLILSGGSYFWFINKQKQSNLKTQNTLLSLQQSLIEAELSSLNNQLNPHEIKNLLAHISPEIQEKAPDSYKKMLKLFNLTKASLNSSSLTDSIGNQLQQIDDFLSLEKSMSSIPLEFAVQNTIENTQTQIPRLLLKNLVENSIKHGIKQQETGGNITVQIEEKDHFICITVDDTGKGRNLAISLDCGIGTTTYQKLFATLNPKNKENATFDIIDKHQGTKVEVKIPMDYKYS